MATSEVAICNSALLKIGASAITALTDNHKKAKLCNEQYYKLRDDLLRAHPWNFAKKRASLREDHTGPAFEWAKQFCLPTDYLRCLKMQDDAKYTIEGDLLLTNESEANILYISKITDTTKFEANFDELLALYLAYELSYPLVQSNSLKATIQVELNMKLRDVRSYNAQEGFPEEFEADEYLDARL